MIEQLQKNTALSSELAPFTLPKCFSSFTKLAQTVSGIEAIDYFFAKEMFAAVNTHIQAVANAESETPVDTQNQTALAKVQQAETLFMLFVVLSASMRDGHTCLPIASVAGRLYGESFQQAQIKHAGFQFPLLIELEQLLSCCPITPDQQQAVVYFAGALYSRRYFSFEHNLQQLIDDKNSVENQEQAQSTLLEQQENLSVIKNIVAQLFPENREEVEQQLDWQKIAVANALNKNFSVIAGGPGTGKTYTVTKLLIAQLLLAEQAANTQQTENTEQTGQANKTLNISLVAPTGKAAQRLSESIKNAVTGFKGLVADEVLAKVPEQAQTIHRLLGVIPNKVGFKHHENNQLNIDVLLVDEVSMVDLALMNRLLQAIPASCKVVLLGDADQLPSVAIGNVLSDIAPRPHPGFSSENIDYLTAVATSDKGLFKGFISDGNNACDHLTILTKSRRFDGEGGIGKLAKAVIDGDSKASWQILNDQDNYQELSCYQTELDAWLPALIEQYYLPIFSCSDVEQALEKLAKFRILAATKASEQGYQFLNDYVKKQLAARLGYPQSQHISSGQLFHGQPIMISENHYGLGLFNGDIGMLWQHSNGQLMAAFPNSSEESTADSMANSAVKGAEAGENKGDTHVSSAIKWLMPTRLPAFETVYAMTIHKTQGSEFEHVAMVLPQTTGNKLLSRELLYTGITRAKKLLTISTNPQVWRIGVNVQVQRYSGFHAHTKHVD